MKGTRTLQRAARAEDAERVADAPSDGALVGGHRAAIPTRGASARRRGHVAVRLPGRFRPDLRADCRGDGRGAVEILLRHAGLRLHGLMAELFFPSTYERDGFSTQAMSQHDGRADPVIRELLQNCLDGARRAGRGDDEEAA